MKAGRYLCTYWVFECPFCGAACWVPMGDTINPDVTAPDVAEYPQKCWKCEGVWCMIPEKDQGPIYQGGPPAFDGDDCSPDKTYQMIEKKHAKKAKKKRKKGKKDRS